MTIRQEKTSDRDAVYQVVKEAFAHAKMSDGHEQDLVVALRKSQSFITELSLVAEEDGKIIGYILFTRAMVGNAEVLALAPLAVLPEYQNRGVGFALIEHGHAAARQLGYAYSVVLGHAGYYPKAGYASAKLFGISAPFDVDDANFLAICFLEESGMLNGVMQYDPAFGV